MDSHNSPVHNSSFSLNIQAKAKKLGYHNLACSSIAYDFQETFEIDFPRIGFIIVSFIVSDELYQKFVNADIEDGQAGRLYVTGLSSGPSVKSRYRGKGVMYTMKLHPVIAHHLLKTPMSQLIDQLVPLTDILTQEALVIRQLESTQQISSFDDYPISKFLYDHLPEIDTLQRDPIYHAVNTIIEKKGNIRIGTLADQCHMSERTLNRHFLNKVGLPPKAYAKIWQWQHVTYLLQTEKDLALEDLAVKAGYYDVAHLVHDFKARLPQTPTQFVKDVNPLIKDYLQFPPLPD